MWESKTVMVGEKSGAHQYKLMENVVEGGIMDGTTTVVVFCPKGRQGGGIVLVGLF